MNGRLRSRTPLYTAGWAHAPAVAAGGLLLLGLALRLIGAWWYRHSTNPDYGIVALMARHMAEGRSFPVFFYGQAYMGSLEPAFSALLCRIMGTRGFVVCLGTALLSFLLLPVVFAWARDARGRGAGIAAVLYCLIGSEGFFHYQCSPRGGYAVTLLIGTLTIWLACRTAVAERTGQRVTWKRYALLGLLAGLGLWSNFLVAPALLTAALVLLLFLRERILRLRAAAGAIGLALGSAPLWIWNAKNEWQSLAMSEAMGGGRIRLLQGLRLLWTERLPSLLNLDAASAAWNWAVAGLTLLLVLAGLARNRAPRTPQNDHGGVYLYAAVGFLAIFALVFASSSFAAVQTPRYLLPLFPVLAVLLGAGTAGLLQRAPAGLAFLPILALVAWQTRHLPNHPARAARDARHAIDHGQVADVLRRERISAVYAHYVFHGLNFLLDEEFVFTPANGDRYAPYSRAAEHAPDIAVLQNHGGIFELLAATDGHGESAVCGRFRLAYGLAPPPPAQTVPFDRWLTVVDGRGRDVRSVLNDAHLDSAVRVSGETHLVFTLDRETDLCGVRIVSPPHRYPAAWQIDVREDLPGANWRAVTETLRHSGYYWDGPRCYWNGPRYSMECRFPAQATRWIRIRLQDDGRGRSGAVSELQLLQPAEAVPDAWPVSDVVEALRGHGIVRLHAGRWIANTILAAAGREIQVQYAPRVPPPPGLATLTDEIRFEPGLGILCRFGETDATRNLIRRLGLQMSETPLGDLTLFHYAPGQWSPPDAAVRGIAFRGMGCLVADYKQWAAHWIERANADSAPSPAVRRGLEEAVTIRPDYAPVALKLADILRTAGDGHKADRLLDTVRRLTTPDIPARAEFDPRIVLKGLSLDRLSLRPGETLQMRHFWSCPPEVDPSRLAVFVHFVSGQTRFQDDHVLLAHRETRHQPVPEIFVEERAVGIPTDTPPGTYEIRLGLYDRRPPHRRRRVRSEFALARRQIVLPVRVQILPAQPGRASRIPEQPPETP